MPSNEAPKIASLLGLNNEVINEAKIASLFKLLSMPET